MFVSSRKFPIMLTALILLSVTGLVSFVQVRPAFAQTLLLFEDFEDSTVAYTTSVPEFSDGSGDFFVRTDGSGIGAFVEYANIQGNSFFAAMDLDGDGNPATTTMTFANIDIADIENLQFSIYLAEDDDSTNQDWDDDTSLLIQYQIDGGSFQNLLAVEAEGGTNTVPRIDSDFDGIGDGTEITNVFAEFTAAITGTGSTLTVQITFAQLEAGDEDIAIDNVKVMGAAASSTPVLVINEIDSDTPGNDTAEFIELYDGGVGSVSLDGLVLVFFNGSGDTSYMALDLDTHSTSASGYFVAGNPGVTNVGLVFAPGGSGALQNGPDAVALYQGNATDFPNGTAITTTNLLDAVVYDTSDADDAGLLTLLNAGQPQVDENSQGDKDNQSSQRCPNGSGGQRNTETFTQLAPTPGSANTCSSETAPSVTTTTPADSATDVPVGSNITINFSENVTLTANAVSVECPTGTSVAFTGLPASDVNTVTLDPTSDLPATTTCTVTVVAAEVTDADSDDPPDAMAADFTFSFTTTNPALACTDGTLTLISAVQGSGDASLLVGTVVTVEGIVTGDFQDGAAGTSGDLNGFYLQEESADEDGAEATSEGIFVFQGSNPAVDVNPGNTVRVTGEVVEFNSLTELTNVTTVEICPPASTIADVTQREVTLPYTNTSELERYENMYVVFPQALVISEYFNYDRFGEIVLAQPLNGEDRPYTPTAIEEPGSVAAANRAANNLRSRITLDDGRTVQNPDPVRHPNGADFSLTNSFRGGDQVQDATGVLTYDFGLYRLQPTAPATYIPVNSRPAQPDAVGGTLKVASFNVLNYFNGDGLSGGFPTSRGADSIEEFQRQEAKIVNAIIGTGADIVGLIEIENDPTSENSALDDLVDAINTVAGAGTFDYIPTGVDGTDEIKVALIYKPATVTPLGAAAVFEDSSFTDPASSGTDKNRPALAQTFVENSSNGAVTVVVNHLKSKGSGCGAGDDDPEQGSCNLTRTLAAQALADWLATDPTGSGDPDYLVMGDLNAYDKEDPIDALKLGADDTSGTADDYTDLLFQEIGEFAYSYVFDGQFGYLDYALANGALLPQVTGATVWHINADEPDILDYEINLDSDPAPERNLAWYANTPYRSSDHDPVIVGLNLAALPGQLTVTKVVVNDNGGTATVASFTLYANATQLTSGVPATLPAGTYQISEAGQSGYRATFSGDCNAQGLLQLGAGESKSCTITNNDIAPVTLTIADNVPATPGGTATVDVTYNSSGNSVVVALFSIDFDESCLIFDPTDANSDGIPDAIAFNLPADFGRTVQVDLADLDGELDISIQDVTSPLMALPNGNLLTIDFGVSTAAACQPSVNSTLVAPVVFSDNPAASFGGSGGEAIPANLSNGGVLISGDAIPFGDCNGDDTVDAGDISALILEIFDGDGDFWTDAPGGTFAGTETCDANEDTLLNAADISCTVLLIFNGPGACGSNTAAESVDGTTTTPASRLFLPIVVTAND